MTTKAKLLKEFEEKFGDILNFEGDGVVFRNYPKITGWLNHALTQMREETLGEAIRVCERYQYDDGLIGSDAIQAIKNLKETQNETQPNQ